MRVTRCMAIDRTPAVKDARLGFDLIDLPPPAFHQVVVSSHGCLCVAVCHDPGFQLHEGIKARDLRLGHSRVQNRSPLTSVSSRKGFRSILSITLDMVSNLLTISATLPGRQFKTSRTRNIEHSPLTVRTHLPGSLEGGDLRLSVRGAG